MSQATTNRGDIPNDYLVDSAHFKSYNDHLISLFSRNFEKISYSCRSEGTPVSQQKRQPVKDTLGSQNAASNNFILDSNTDKKGIW